MKTVELTKENAMAAYKNGSQDQKQLLATLYPDLFGSIINRIKTVEDACKELGIDFDDLFDDCEDEIDEAEVAIKTFAKALREGKPVSECFYYPYFYTSGGGFSFYVCGLVRDCSYVGARLRVDSAEKATHMGKCLLEYYKKYLKG
ncbi:hypothetical protein ABDK00_017015 [Niabella insulamsoli]|uniref:hypothetical protein n=1 Tax=Niabella insulamsoli TaxID=3144874 RepID=UPI0031FD56AC